MTQSGIENTEKKIGASNRMRLCKRIQVWQIYGNLVSIWISTAASRAPAAAINENNASSGGCLHGEKTPSYICPYMEAKKIEVQNSGGFLVPLPQLASHAGEHRALLWCTAALVGGIKRLSWFTELWNGDTLCMEMKGNISVQAARARLWGSGGEVWPYSYKVLKDLHGGWERMSCCCINIKLSVTLLRLNTW